MVALPQQYDTNDPKMQDSGGVVLIPQGAYKAVITASDLKDSSKGGKFLALTVVITEGEHAHTEFTERLNIINDNPVAVDIAYKTLARISEAIGLTKTPADSSELHNKPLMIIVETEAGKPWTDKDNIQREGKDKSIIKTYKPLGSVPPTQAQSKPEQAVAQEAQAAPTAPPSTPPWAEK